jgi:flagellin-like protein
MRGVSEVIAIILILMITISLAGLAYMFMSTTMSDTTTAASSTVSSTTNTMLKSFRVESIHDNTVYIRNTGTADLYNVSVYVNDTPVGFFGSGSIGGGQVSNITLLTQLSPRDIIKVTFGGSVATASVSESSPFSLVYDDQDPSTFSEGWGWDGWDACCRDSSTRHCGSYSYRVDEGSEAWRSPLPSSAGTTSFTFAYKKQNPDAHFSVYYHVNGYWHQVTDDSSHHYQGWSIPHIADTEWHVVRVYFDEETSGTGGEPKVSSEGQLADFEYGGSVMWFDCTYFS